MGFERSYVVHTRRLAAAMLVCVAGIVPIADAQDGSPFVIGEHKALKFFEIESFRASLEGYWRYRVDERTDNSGVTTRDTETLFRESLLLGGKGFLGNPNLVKLDLNAKLRLSQETFDSNSTGRNERTAEFLSEYDVSALILQRGDSPLTIYSRRSEVLLDRQFADSLDSITTEHGARLTLRSDFMPNDFQFFRREQEQTGRFSGTDSKLTQDTFAWQGRIRPINGHRLWWDYTFSNVQEIGTLVVPNTFTRHDAFLNHTYDFGSDAQHSLRSSVRFYKETGKFPIERFRWTETLDLEHTPDFETRYVYLFDQQKRRGTDQRLHRGVASFQHDLFESLTTTGQLGASVLSITDGDFESTQYFGDLGLKYQKIVPYGVLNATADFNFNLTDDGTRGSSIFITDEPHTFGPSGIITINRRNILLSSIVVKDITGITTYFEGADYTVFRFGEVVEIRRVLGGNIAAGQSVLITYEIGPEPATTTDTVGYGLTFRYRFDEGALRGLSPYVRYRDQRQTRTSRAILANPKNDFQDLIFGVDYDIGRVSLTAEHQIHDSTISPFEMTRFEGRYMNRINSRNSVSLSAYYQETDRVDEDLRTTVSNVTARWNAQPNDRLRSSLLGIWRRETDNAGSDSDAYELALDLTWRHRQTIVYCTMRNAFVESNTSESTFQTFLFGIRRDF